MASQSFRAGEVGTGMAARPLQAAGVPVGNVVVIRGECEALMNTDLNGKIQGKLNQNRKNRNTKKALLVLSLAAVIFTSTVLANPASALTEDVSGEVVQGLENNSDAQAADEQANAQGNEAAPSSDPQETLAAPSADQGVMNANSVSAVDSAAVTENGTEDSGIAVSGAEADGTKKSADQISAAEGTGTAEQGATLAEAAETVSTEEAAADKTTEKTEQAAQSETDVLSFADDRAQVKIARKDGTGFPSDTTMSGSPLGTDDWNRVLSAVSAKVKAQSDDSTAYSVAGLHTWTFSLQAGDGSAASYDDIRAEAEFQGGLNDAGYATKTSEKEESRTDGTSTTTANYETSWRVYAISGDSIADPVEDHLTDLTDADGTSLSVDENGALQSAAFDGSLPETVVFAQIVRETVTTGTEKKKEIPMPAVTFDKEAATDHGTITVHVEADEGTFEQGTTMSVKQVSSQDILDKAIEAAGGKGSAAAVDISFRKADGTETEPAKPIRVKMTAKVLSQADKVHVVHVDDTGSTDVVAKKSDGKTIESTSSEAASSDAKNAVSFESDSFSVYAIVYTVDFKYSVNGKTYQFSLHGEEKIALSDLIEVLGIIDDTNFKNVKAFLKEIDTVTFSDEDLLAVTKVTEETTFADIDAQVFDVFAAGGEEPEEDKAVVSAPDWVLTSLAPFSSEETLVISMKNGDEITIDVTDDQETNLAEFITDASLEIEGKTYGQGQTWNVREGVDYALKLTFKESGSRQFPQGGEEIVMNLKDLGGMSLEPGQSGTFDIPMGLYGTVTGNTWWVDNDGKLHIQFGPDPDNLLTRSNNVYFNLEMDVKFSGSGDTVEFNDRVERDWTADTSSDISINKTGHYNSSTGKMEYTVTVTSTGNNTNVKITDTFATSNLLTLDQGSITITPDKELASNGNSTSASGFTRVISSMSHGETVTITYTADVNEAALGAGGKVTGDDGKNNVKVETDQGKEDEKTNIVNEINFSDLSKITTSSVETEDDKVNMSWKITANEGKKASLVGSTISDRIDWNSKDIMKYASADGKVSLSIVGTDAEGHTYTKTVQVNVNDNQGQESWAWVVESLGEPAGTPLTYEISYQTIVTKPSSDTIVKNEATNDAGGSHTGTGVVPGTNPGGGGGDEPTIVTQKAATAVTPDYIDWSIVINVPEEGFPDGLTVIDNLPSLSYSHDDGYGFADQYVEGSLSISGLTGNEDYTLTVEDNNDGYNRTGVDSFHSQKLTIEFYKSSEKTDSNKGLNAGARTITISLRTTNDKLWMADALKYNGGDPRYEHKNTGTVNGVPVTATGIPLNPDINKKLAIKYTKDGLPYYTYQVDLSNVTEVPVVITDTFDTDYLEFNKIGDDQWDARAYIAAASQKNNLNGGIAPYAATEVTTADGIIITADDLPKKDNGSFYEYYRIYYSLKVKDADALAALEAEAIANGGKYTLHNTAVWGDLSDDFDVDYEVTAVNKEGYFASNNAEERKFTFVIDANPSRFKLGSDGTVELTDQHTDNLSVDYSSVKIYEIPAGVTVSDAKSAVQNNQITGWLLKSGEDVPWNFSGNEGTFYLKDETHYVIVYDAIVIGSGNQKFSNVADLNGFISSKEGEKTYSNDQSAGGEVWEIKLLKYKDGLTSHGLQGATFQLFRGTGEYVQVSDNEGNTWWEEEKEPMKYGDTPTTRANGTVGANITFTTGSDGTVNIQVDQVRDGNELEGGVHYFLKEIDSPSGYQIDSSTEYWAFTLTNDPDEVNYGDPNRPDEYGNRQWVYFYYNDILKIANTETHEPLDVVVKKTWYDKDGNKITGEKLDKTFVATVQLLRKTDDGDYVPVKVEYGTDGKPSSITEVSESTSDSQIQLTNGNDWSYTWSQLPRVEMGGDKGLEVIHRYAYKIEEVSVDGYVVSLTESETETVKTYALKNYATPDNKTTDILVNKNWQDSDGTAIEGTADKLPDEIQFKLYRAVSTTPFTRVPSTGGSLYVISGDTRLVNQTATEGADDYGVYKLTKANDWQTTFAALPETETTGGTTYYYAYYVKEIPMSGYTTTYTSNGTTRTITNREPLPEGKYISIGLEKKWTDGTNTTPPSGASATFTVHQQKSTKSGADGSISVTAGEYSTSCNPGDTITVSYTGAANSGDNIVFNSDYQWCTADSEGNGTKSYIIPSNYSGSTMNIWVQNRNLTITSLSSDAEPSYSDFEPTDFTRTISLPTTAGTWSTTIKDLIQEDAEGNLYRYYITEDSCTPTATTVAFKDKEGNDIKDTAAEGVNQTTASLNATGQKVEVTNTYENEMGAVKVTKSFSGVDSLPTGFQIANDYNGTVFTVGSSGMTGTGTADDPYAWILDNVPVGTEVTFTESGATVDGAALTITANGTAVEAGSETATAKATSAKVETGGEYPTAAFVNEYEQTTDFEFSKIWKNIGNQSTTWPTGATITVTMNAYTDTSQKAIADVQVTLSADGSAAGVTPAWTATTSAEGTVTTFKVEGLPKYKDGIELHYYVIETQVDNYKAPSYATSEGNGLVFTGSDVPKATNGQQIINTPEGGYELPHTGGHGTLPLTGAGALLLLLAGTALTVRKLLIQRNTGKGGGSE